MAPECINKKDGHSMPRDIWALGVIIFTMLVGQCPFESNSVEATYRKIKSNHYLFPRIIPISDIAKKLLSKIFNIKPA